MDRPAEAVLVDDGNRDGSYQLMAAAGTDPRFKVLRLSSPWASGRHHGWHGLRERARRCRLMDADLQDPPEVVLEMAARWRRL